MRRIRKEYEKTLKEVSEGTGLSISFLSDMERDVTLPSLKTLVKLSEFYNAPYEIDSFMYGVLLFVDAEDIIHHGKNQ